MTENCIFCKVRDGDTTFPKLHEDDLVYAVDVPPDMPFYLGPVHFLVIPNAHVPSALYLTDDDATLAGRLFAVAGKLAREKCVAETGFRLITNAGPDANQTIFHLHLHCIGGHKLTDL